MKEDKEVIKFLETCGEPNLQFLTRPARLKKALEVLDEDGSGEIDIHEWELAIQRGLAKRLEQLAIERERRDRAAMAADEEFTTEFLNAAREVFIMAREPAPIAAFKAKPSRARERRKNRDSRVVCSQIDVDESGDLEKAEIIDAVKNNQACGRRR